MDIPECNFQSQRPSPGDANQASQGTGPTHEQRSKSATFQQALEGLLSAVERRALDEVVALEKEVKLLRLENEDLHRKFVSSQISYASHHDEHFKDQMMSGNAWCRKEYTVHSYSMTNVTTTGETQYQTVHFSSSSGTREQSMPSHRANAMEAVVESPEDHEHSHEGDTIPTERNELDMRTQSSQIIAEPEPEENQTATDESNSGHCGNQDNTDFRENSGNPDTGQENDGGNDGEDPSLTEGDDGDDWATHLIQNSSLRHNKMALRAAKVIDYVSTIKEPNRTSCLAKFVHSKAFEGLCISVIVINSMLTVYTTNYMMSMMTDTPTSFVKTAEISFLGFYCTELLLKLIVHRLYFFCNNDLKWNWFDLGLIMLALADLLMTQIGGGGSVDMTFMRSFRLLKLSKVLRMFRVLRFFADLRLMLDCVAGSFLSLLWCFVILGFFWIIFALLFVQGVAGYLIENKGTVSPALEQGMIENFGSVEIAIFTLFQAITGGTDWKEYYDIVSKVGTLNSVLFVFYIIFFIFAACNIVTSVFIDKAMKLAQPDIETLLFEKQREDWSNARELKKICLEQQTEEQKQRRRGTITYAEFNSLMTDERIRTYFELKGLAIKDAELFFQMLGSVSQTEEVDIDAFIAGCMKMKGFALSVDLLSLGFETKLIGRAQGEFITHVHDSLANMQETLSKLANCIPRPLSI